MPYRERLNNANGAKRITESFGYSSTGEATSSITDIFATLSGTNSQLTTMTVGEALAAANPQPGDIDNTQTFVSDDNIGTSWNPYVIDLSDVLTGITVVNGSPVDDSDWWTLQGYKIGRKPTQPGVYIHHGKKVTIKRKK